MIKREEITLPVKARCNTKGSRDMKPAAENVDWYRVRSAYYLLTCSEYDVVKMRSVTTAWRMGTGPAVVSIKR